MSSEWIWGIWLLVAALTFGGLEAWAILGKQREPKTLTEVLRRWLGVQPKRWWRGIASAGLVAGASWLVLHLVFGF